MKSYRILNIKGAVLEKHQLEQYLEQLASDHILKEKSDKDTYPIPRMKENFEFIGQIYQLLNEHIKLKIPIHPAGEWILDNYYAIEETVKAIEKEISLKKYKNFLAIANGAYSGFARIYVLASEIVAYTDAKIHPKTLSDLLRAYQFKKTLSMEEIWNLGTFLQIALIENIRNICEKIYASQLQKYKVENIIERLIENKSRDELQFRGIREYESRVNEHHEMKYPFIEYMSYRLRRYGKSAYPFLNVLEEQVGKMGTDISEVIKKEHFDIAVKKVSIGNAITSIKTLQRTNFVDIFEEINKVDDLLKNDPAQIYDKMDYKTKVYYRSQIEELSRKTKISEIYIAKKCLELAQNAYQEYLSYDNEKNLNKNTLLEKKKQTHIGYYLIAQGKEKLLESLQNRRIRQFSNSEKMAIYIVVKKAIAIILTIICSIYFYKKIPSIILAVITAFLLYIPIEEIVIQVMQYILGKIVKPRLIPKLDFQNGIPKENSTFVVIPTILNDTKKVNELMKKLEVYYIANQSDNIYFALLGDCCASKNETEPFDEEIIKTGTKLADELNKKYPQDELPKFHFIYRNRQWNEKEECYLGWERKRGLLNQFNEYILGNNKNQFRINTIESERIHGKVIPKIRYIITLDADTDLVLNSGLELIGAMSHLLNKPVLNENKTLVIDGYGIMQPRVGVSLKAARKTLFTKIYAGTGGTDSYTNAISDVYQDNFEEGIFTGKGIYDVDIFSKVLKNEIAENTVLSHDLLEGNYIRCALASDIILIDGYPTSYTSFKTRLHRWTRGDWQIIKWLNGNIQNKNGKIQKNPLGIIAKYKILDNLVRSVFTPIVFLAFIYLFVLSIMNSINIWPFILVLGISLLSPMLIQIMNRIIFKQNAESKQKTFDKSFSVTKGNIIRAILEIATLPDKAYMMIDAIFRTIYRMCISKKHLLEWTTAEDAEKQVKCSLKAYYMSMIFNVFCGIIGILLVIIAKENTAILWSVFIFALWIIAPAILYYISKPIKKISAIDKINQEEKDYILEVGRRTWDFFKENINAKGNFLPPDNYQEDRDPKVVYRTSPTNIGLGLLAVVSSYDLGYENLEDTIKILKKMLNSIEKLSKWNGHLYNWYNIENLEPLIPKYVSTVDSGNFVGYLYVVKQFLEEIKVETVEKSREKYNETVYNIDTMIDFITNLIKNTKFEYLYSPENKIFSIGYNVEENQLTPSFYDLLASEARQASLVAIAKKDVSSKHWYSLNRTLTILNKYKGLISWSGTAFEYLMPNVNIPQEEGSLLSESIKFAIMSQREYARKLMIPWGVSEAAFNLRDLNNNYQYKAFGIPWLGIKRGLADEIVVSAYGSVLAINEEPKEVIQNLKELEKQGMYDKYGFYESIDYTPSRLKKGEDYAVVKTYMAHHQGLILLSINNLYNNQIFQKRFMDNPEIRAIDILLQERMPENVIITKEKKEKIEKIKSVDYEAYCQREYHKINEKLMPINVISNDDYTVVMDQKGNGYSKYKDVQINRYKTTDDEQQGIFFYLKNIKTNRIWTSSHMNYLSKPDRYTTIFTPDKSKYVRQDGNIETTTKVCIMPDEPVEIRQIELKNYGITEELIEITSVLEPIISSKQQDYAHKAFNNLFLSYEFIEDSNIILIKRKQREQTAEDIYLAVNLYTQNETIGEIEYEIDKEKFFGRGNINLPKEVEKATPLGRKIGLATESILSIRRTIKVLPEETVKLNLIMAISNNKEEALSLVNKNQNNEKIARSMNLAKAKVEAESMYLGIKGKEIEVYQKILGYLIKQNPLKMLMYKGNIPNNAHVSELWKYGISGDLPILVIKIKDVNDIYVVKEAIKAYEYFRIKNIEIDLIIINEEKKTYDNYVYEEIQNAILDRGISYLQNIYGGIFVLNSIEKEARKVIEYRANLLIDASLGGIGRQLKDFEEEYVEKHKEIANEQTNFRKSIETEKIRQSLPGEDLKYYNEYGGFSNDGKEYLIRINKEERLPTVWSHVLSNSKFGTVVTENMGGYTWYKNSRLNRLTAWNNSPITDIPSEVIFMEDLETKKAWSLGLNPMPDDNDYYITYGLGYSKYQHTSCGISQKLDIFVPREDSVKVQILHLENMQPKKKDIKIIYYLKPVLDEDEIKSNGFINIQYKANANMITARNTIQKNKQYLYVSSSEKIVSYTGSKKDFIGSTNLSNPQGLRKLELDGQNALGKEPIIAIELKITLESLERKDIVLVMGAEEEMIECEDKAYRYTNINNAISEYEREKRYWNELTQRVQVSTPLESTNILLNGWLIYQTLCSRIWARSGYYQSGGAYGFRDQLQDCIAMKYIEPQILKEQIIKHSEHQFIEGDVEHWWHDEISRGIRTRFSDDLLWMPYLTADYIEFTGDSGLLDIETNYLKGEILPDGVDEKYDLYLPSDTKENIYKHCIRAIEKSLNFGENGLPKIGSGDWNDGFSTVGNKGKGESVWLGFFMYSVLDKFIPICEQKKDTQLVEKYKKVMENLKRALNTAGWDGRWYKRAFMDNGDVLGSIQNEECRIDSIAQSWSTISGAGDNDKKYISIESLENHLIDRENGIIKLLDPPFEKSKLEPGYIKAYLPGTRENGGQYTHECCC